MAVKKAIVMRHAEKPKGNSDIDLTPAGRQRAKNLVAYLKERYGVPDFIFAAHDSRESSRCVETVRPFAEAVGVAIDHKFANGDYKKLAKHLLNHPKFDGKVVLICWHHGEIPGLLEALKAPHGSYPDPWDPHVFDLIVELDYSRGSKEPAVHEIKEPF